MNKLTLIEIFTNYINILYNLFLYDLDVFSNPILYALIIPFFFYLIFFFIKWTILTTPIWLPISLIFSKNNTSKCACQNKEKD